MPKKILLADDSITIQKVVELTFSDGDYEVIATNNGTKAIEEIPKVRPDIILSDIIMPEKNGYEVCEWVKSHPEHRTIPVILLTGTFEPFDPDRAEKAGCDAVVTKPFESQSLIQKVEELIGSSAPAPEVTETQQHPVLEDTPESAPLGEAAEPEAAAEQSRAVPPPPRLEEAPATRPEVPEPPTFELDEPSATESSPFEGSESDAAPSESAPAFPPVEEEPKPQGDVFASEVPSQQEEEMDDSATRIIPKMSMEDIQRLQQQQEQESPQEPTSAEPESIPFDGTEPAAEPAEEEPTPHGDVFAPDVPSRQEEEEDEDSATRIIPKMSMEEIQRLQQQQEQESSQEQASEPESIPFGGADEPEEEPSPFSTDEEPAPLEMGEPSTASEEDEDAATRMIPKMAFQDLPDSEEAATAESDEQQEEESASAEVPEAPETPGLTGAPAGAETAVPNPFEAEAEDEPQSPQPSMEEAAPFAEPPAEQIPPPPLPPETPASDEEPVAESEEEPVAASSAPTGDLSEDQIEKIAKKVVELLSDKVVREIAWEVIPETAEMIVRERIRELESQEE